MRRARIDFTITQYPGLRANLPLPIDAQLEKALAGHRHAIALQPDNADALFNTAQVMSSLAEEIHLIETERANSLLEEALTLLSQCLELQSEGLRRQQILIDKPDESQENPVEAESAPDSSSEETEAWATIEEPVTVETLLDTVTATYDVMENFCSLLPPSRVDLLGEIEKKAERLEERIPQLLEQVDQQLMNDLLLAQAKFKASMLEAAFGAGKIDIQGYDQGLKAIFEVFQDNRPPALFHIEAEALIDLAIAASKVSSSSLLRWNRLARALDLLAQETQLVEKDDLFRTHTLRGDAEMMRHSIVTSTNDLPKNLTSVSVQQTLLGNAAKFYRGAIALNHASPDSIDLEQAEQTIVKEALVSCLTQAVPDPLYQLSNGIISPSRIRSVLHEAIEETVTTRDELVRCGLIGFVSDGS